MAEGDDRGDDDQVGYGKTPWWTRWRKGESGNRKGRPKGTGKKQMASKNLPTGDSELDAMQRKVLDKKVKVNVEGKAEHIKMQEVILHTQASLAAKGNALAARDVIKQAANLERREIAREAIQADADKMSAVEQADLNRRVFQHIAELKISQKKAWDLAKLEGRSEPDYPWPHPDDILIDEHRQKYRIQGPYDDTQVAHYEWIRAERDVAFMTIVIKIKARSKAADATLRLASFSFYHHDALLPKRWQIAQDFEWLAALHLELRSAQLQKALASDKRKAEMWKAISGNSKPCPEAYRVANAVLAPVLKKQGYRSLAQFERAYEDTNGNPPWPRRTDDSNGSDTSSP